MWIFLSNKQETFVGHEHETFLSNEHGKFLSKEHIIFLSNELGKSLSNEHGIFLSSYIFLTWNCKGSLQKLAIVIFCLKEMLNLMKKWPLNL